MARRIWTTGWLSRCCSNSANCCGVMPWSRLWMSTPLAISALLRNEPNQRENEECVSRCHQNHLLNARLRVDQNQPGQCRCGGETQQEQRARAQQRQQGLDIKGRFLLLARDLENPLFGLLQLRFPQGDSRGRGPWACARASWGHLRLVRLLLEQFHPEGRLRRH